MFFLLLLFIEIGLWAQSVAYSSAEMFDDILRLKNDISVMYLAAHPDDENTSIISWLTHDRHVDAVYLSLTRGEGGQNLIGTEKGALLGFIRTQELLEARKIDKGRQWFSRAIDFGYSKTIEDTYHHWDKTELLRDVVWAIRVNRPAIIITRFHPDSNGQTHGHHTVSAQLAMEAYDLAANPLAFPEQLKFVDTWQVKRIFYNTSWWFYGSREAFDKVDKSEMIAVDVGKYFPHLGISNNEIAAKSRSKHASQGFGTALKRGSDIEWLELLKGDKPKSQDIFEGIKTEWSDRNIQNLAEKIINEFNFNQPSTSVPALNQLYERIKIKFPNHVKLKEIERIIQQASGIYAEWTTSSVFGYADQAIKTSLEVANRGKKNLTYSKENPINLAENSVFSNTAEFTPSLQHIMQPFWMENDSENSFYQIKKPELNGLASNENPVSKTMNFQWDETAFQMQKTLMHKSVNPSTGEVYTPFYVVPAFVVNFVQSHMMFNGNSREIQVEVISQIPDVEVEVGLRANSDWEISPTQKFKTAKPGEKQLFRFYVKPKTNNTQTVLRAEVWHNGNKYDQSLQIIEYPHIQKQIWLHSAKANLVNTNMAVPNVKVAYIQGSGDDVPAALQSMGIQVDEISVESISTEFLSKYDVVILGIRAMNTRDELKFKKYSIWEFAQKGGVVIMQYNTHRELIEQQISPIPLTLGRDRIADENAIFKILQPNHSVFNKPNPISSQDFEGWHQERGLYFAESWDKNFIALLEGNDPGESPKQGILLVGDYGNGKFVYTGISFFRQLPAGVPGAYRLMMNLLALGEKNN
ncbi:MAG: PIG-L family deacetylase [Flavobacteriaceae bacterium]|nr:PIG-L family deacetylase [Flavobacteriaceae bacterium]